MLGSDRVTPYAESVEPEQMSPLGGEELPKCTKSGASGEKSRRAMP